MFWILFIFFTLVVNVFLISNGKQKISTYQPRHIITSPRLLSIDASYFISNDLIKAFGNDEKMMNKFLLNATNIAQKSFAWHNMELRVVKSEFWRKKDRIHINKNFSITLSKLRKYIRDHEPLTDVYLLFTNKKGLTDTLGLSFYKTICSKSAVGLIRVYNIRDPVTTGIAIAHEIGHIIGFEHAEHGKNNCLCAIDNNKCVMNQKTFSWNFLTNSPPFHSCSILDVITLNLPCLNERITNVSLFETCGNGVKSPEYDEECDCGSKQTCKHSKADLCCNYDKCQLKPTFSCSNEVCCENCQIKSGKICRQKKDQECDLEERCTNGNANCGEDLHVYDGKKCGKNAYCFGGYCTDPNKICMRMFPHEENVIYSKKCLKLIQMQAENRNCSDIETRKNDTYTKLFCSTLDPCPRIWCEFKGSGTSSATTVTFKHNGNILNCHTHDDERSLAPTGFPCGKSLGCFGGKCLNIKDFKTKCPNCPPNTICNNLGKCTPLNN